MCGRSGEAKIIDVDHGFFMVKFDLDKGYFKAVKGGRWMIFNHYLAVQHWLPRFLAKVATIDCIRYGFDSQALTWLTMMRVSS